jgi:cysteine desulfurase / selenocysteine lyase
MTASLVKVILPEVGMIISSIIRKIKIPHKMDEKFATGHKQGLDVNAIRNEFPMLTHQVNGRQLIYFDTASTNHKPRRVLDRLYRFYAEEYGKPNESHSLSQQATKDQENARSSMARFIGAKEAAEIVFSRGCTESINMVAGAFARGVLEKGDEVLVTELEHHANIVPWQFACQQSGAVLKVAPVSTDGEVDVDAFSKLLSNRTKIVAFSHSSNAIGNVLPVKELVKLAHDKGIPVLVDGAQYAPHAPINIQELDCDFYTFSGHKMGMPSGVGVLYGKKEWLEKIPAYEGGGDMAKEVGFDKSPVLQAVPKKFEAGTMPFAEIIALNTLLEYLWELDMEKTAAYEQELLSYATQQVGNIDRVRIVGNAPEKEPVLSIALEGMDVKKLERFLNDEYNLDVRAGDLTAQPLMKALKVPGLLRASFCYYNLRSEIDTFVEAIHAFIKKNG